MNDMKLTPQKRSRGHIDRYNGMTEEEVIQRKLPDYLREDLDLIVVGINPSMTSARVGHHYAGIGNHFWTCITEAGLVQEQVTCYDDYRMVEYGMGFTNVCSRPTKGAAEISRKEMKAGALIMLEKMRNYRLLCSQGSVSGLVNYFATCGSVTNNSATSSSDSQSKHVDLVVSNSCNINSQMQITRPMVSSSSTSTISSIAGQTDLDIISSSSGIGDIFHQHFPLQCSWPIVKINWSSALRRMRR